MPYVAYQAMRRDWRKHPPDFLVLKAIAEALGVKFKSSASAAEFVSDVGAFIQMTGGKPGTVTTDMLRGN